MNTFTMEISSPNGSLFHEDINMIALRGADGDLAVMAGHIPFVTSVQPCDFHMELADGEEKAGHVDGGILTVSGTEAVLLTGDVQWIDE